MAMNAITESFALCLYDFVQFPWICNVRKAHFNSDDVFFSPSAIQMQSFLCAGAS